jgi:hypothetical protein
MLKLVGQWLRSNSTKYSVLYPRRKVNRLQFGIGYSNFYLQTVRAASHQRPIAGSGG